MFGFSFGKKKQSGTSNTTLNKNEVTNQQSDSFKLGETTTNSNTTNVGTSSTQQNTNNATTNVSQQQQDQTTQQYSDATLAGLEGKVAQLFGSNNLTNTVNSSIDRLDDFDASRFVSDSVSAATSREQQGLDEFLGGVSDGLGTSIGGNSMAGLLATRAQGDAAARVAGVRANAEATAQGILRDNASVSVGAAGAESGFLGNLLANLKGGISATTGTTVGSEAGTQVGSTTSNTQTAEQQQTQSTTRLMEALSQLLNGNITTTATESGKTTGKSSGGGFSLSI